MKKWWKRKEQVRHPILFEEQVVLEGPFKGMKYPELKAIGSQMYPKLLGCYEHEMHDAIYKFLQNEYKEIIVVGCAEGYYAVGMAMKKEKAKVYAFDTDKEARDLCQQMAAYNSVEDKVVIGELLDADHLASFPFTGRGLIICDCEGYEKQLFTQLGLRNLMKCDLIIETHDYKDIEISSYLKELFGSTHHLSSVFSTDDIQRTLHNSDPLLKDLSLQEKRVLISERRPAIMEWLICEAK